MTEYIKNKQYNFHEKCSNSELLELLNNFSSEDETKLDVKYEESVYYDNKRRDESESNISDKEFFKIFDKIFDPNRNPEI